MEKAQHRWHDLLILPRNLNKGKKKGKGAHQDVCGAETEVVGIST